MLEKIRTFQLNQFNQTLFFTYKALSLCTKCLLESAVHLFTLTERKRLPAGLISWLRYIQPPPPPPPFAWFVSKTAKQEI